MKEAEQKKIEQEAYENRIRNIKNEELFNALSLLSKANFILDDYIHVVTYHIASLVYGMSKNIKDLKFKEVRKMLIDGFDNNYKIVSNRNIKKEEKESKKI